MLADVKLQQVIFIGLMGFFICGFQFINDANNFTASNPMVLIAFFLIMTIGVSHGAMDGKIIWHGFDNIKGRCFAYLVYLLLVFLGGGLWVMYPKIALMFLMGMSVFHFGWSDLRLFPSYPKPLLFGWGCLMTLIPIIFHPAEVNGIFAKLVGAYLTETQVMLLQAFLLVALFYVVYQLLYELKKEELGLFDEINCFFTRPTLCASAFLTLVELIVILMAAVYFHPLLWFTFYFCGLHGPRALIYAGFRWKVDLIWLILFTLPVTFIALGLLINNVFNQNIYLIIFPILASLTIAHMSISNLLKILSPNKDVVQ
jgi:beta-carotene 15,15'-dioxygenase